MRFYVANATHHVASFAYRIVGNTRIRTLPIQMGAQIILPDDLTTDDVNYIIEQHQQYGFVAFDKVADVKTFTGMCYSIDKQIPSMRIEQLFTINREHLVEEGRKNRQEAAVAANNAFDNALENEGGGLRKMTFEVHEEGNGGPDGILDETVTVDPQSLDDGAAERDNRASRRQRRRR